MSPTVRHFAFSIILGLAVSAEAFAQLSSFRSRPSDRSASQTLGRVGGTHTRGQDPANAQTLPAVNRGGVGGGAERGLTGRGRFGNGRQFRGTGPGVPQPGLGTRFFRRPGANSALLRRSLNDTAALRNLSRVSTSQRLDYQPLMGAVAYPRPVANNPIRPTSNRNGTAFHRIFGLTPTEQRDRSAPLDLSMVDMMEEASSQRVDLLINRAYDEFSAATEELDYSVDSMRSVAMAMSALSSASKLESDNPIYPVLEFNGALIQQRYTYAVERMFEALLRDPELFMKPLPIAPQADMAPSDRERLAREADWRTSLASYFGDFQRGGTDADGTLGWHSPTLNQIIEQFRRSSSQAQGDANAIVLEGYSNFLIDESRRAQRAVTALEAFDREEVGTGHYDAFRYALSAALREQ